MAKNSDVSGPHLDLAHERGADERGKVEHHDADPDEFDDERRGDDAGALLQAPPCTAGGEDTQASNTLEGLSYGWVDRSPTCHGQQLAAQLELVADPPKGTGGDGSKDQKDDPASDAAFDL